MNSFTDGSAFCPGAPKRVPSDSEKHTGVYTCHPTFVTATSGVLTRASGKILKKRNACLYAVRQAVGKKIVCLNGLRSEGVKVILLMTNCSPFLALINYVMHMHRFNMKYTVKSTFGVGL